MFQRQVNGKPSIIPGCPGLPCCVLLRQQPSIAYTRPQHSLAHLHKPHEFRSQCAVFVQGCAEIRWLAEKMGAKSSTVSGLSGLGDIMLTCYGSLSRNRSASHPAHCCLASQLCLYLAPRSGLSTALHKHPSLQRYDTAACLPSACFGTYFICTLWQWDLCFACMFGNERMSWSTRLTNNQIMTALSSCLVSGSSKRCSMVGFVRRSKQCFTDSSCRR